MNINRWKRLPGWSGYMLFVAALHAAGLIGLYAAARSGPSFAGLGLLAYTFGLRHAFDADHIAAIDNTVRKLVQQKRSPLGVGFYFSLGHSTVVLLLVLVIAFSVRGLQDRMPLLQSAGGLIGTTVSGLFLTAIGLINLIILIQLFKLLKQIRSGAVADEAAHQAGVPHGLLGRLLKPAFRLVSRSWHLYPLGFLFGLGFDTASEVGLLALSAGAAGDASATAGILSLPLLFAAGMSLLDTADGIVMTRAYRWAFAAPRKKLFYNLTVTALSVVAALAIGLTELFQSAAGKLESSMRWQQWLTRLDFGNAGYVLAALFVLAWGLSVFYWRRRTRA